MTNPYDALSIRVLTPSEASDRFGFAKSIELATRYPHVAQSFINRLVEAATLSATPLDLVTARYLDGDTTVTVPPELYAVFAELADQRPK